jgi:hypothetical protein
MIIFILYDLNTRLNYQRNVTIFAIICYYFQIPVRKIFQPTNPVLEGQNTLFYMFRVSEVQTYFTTDSFRKSVRLVA